MRKIFLIILIIIFPTNVFSVIYPNTPKYASLKKDKVYLRENASLNTDIKKIYQKKYFPILIIDAHDNWRKIRDYEGLEGWIHVSMISNKKTFINKKKQNLYKYKDNLNIINAIVNKNVIGKIINCKEKFCKVKINSYKGWINKEYLWGIKKN